MRNNLISLHKLNQHKFSDTCISKKDLRNGMTLIVTIVLNIHLAKLMKTQKVISGCVRSV